MSQSLQVGNITFPVNLIQGPLAGVSCAPFRYLTWQYGQVAFSCTEMISCKTLIHTPPASHQRFVVKHPQEGPVCFQLSGNNPNEVGQAVKIATDYGADLIDLNCGCPVKKIRSKGAGSSLLTNPTQLYELIKAMKANTHVPVSVKIRVEGGSGDRFNLEVAQAVRDGGADFLIVHGRHWTEHYETPCNHDEIRFFVEEMKIPVIGNGDIADLASYQKMLATGCAGVMIGRAGVGQPWLTKQLIAEATGETFSPPSLSERAAMLLDHTTQLIELLDSEKFAILQMRKMAKYYARGLEQRTEFCEAINQCISIDDIHKLLPLFFK